MDGAGRTEIHGLDVARHAGELEFGRLEFRDLAFLRNRGVSIRAGTHHSGHAIFSHPAARPEASAGDHRADSSHTGAAVHAAGISCPTGRLAGGELLADLGGIAACCCRARGLCVFRFESSEADSSQGYGIMRTEE